MNIKVTAFALGLGSLVAAAPVSAANIVTSIKPLELLVKAVAGDETNVTTLVPPGSSPHNYSMKPSQRRALENADAIFWVGPDMETFLERLLGSEEFEGRVLAFTEAGEHNEEEENEDHNDHGHDDHGHNEHNHSEHAHDHGNGEDPHIWVDPSLALEMAHDIHSKLSTLGEFDQQTLDSNLASFEQKLDEREHAIEEQLAPLADISLFSYHSAFERFAEHYNLNLEGVLTLNPELSPGARHIADVQKQLEQANQPCLLTEPQFNRQWWRSITEGLNVTFSTWDPLAMDIESNRDGYLAFQQSIADAVLKCSPQNAEQ
ncbi:MAG: zinc ABC transporter substrate-binding protein [Alteromonadaceae bacterium]|nr:zinc ABC transporter substrate-binding protein [Alteromonadaceae bacterium]